MRVNGEVLGWVINHRAPPNFVVFTTAFVRKDFQRIGALFKLLVHSIVNIQDQGLCITFVTSSMYPRMLPFTLTRIGPYGDFCGETRGVTKKLAGGDGVSADAASMSDALTLVPGTDRESWNAFVEASPHGHVFQTWEWGELQADLQRAADTASPRCGATASSARCRC